MVRAREMRTADQITPEPPEETAFPRAAGVTGQRPARAASQLRIICRSRTRKPE